MSNPALRTSEIFPARMPELARRRNPAAPDERWHVYRDPVPVPRMRKIIGAGPVASIPGCHPRECTGGNAATFDQARADFEDAWRVFLSNRIAADFQAWRDQRDWTVEKYRRFDRGERMPPNWKAA